MRKDMHKEILENIFKLGGKHFGEDDYNKYQYVVDNTFNGRTRENISETYEETENLLNPLYPQLPLPEYSEHFIVRSLGRIKSKENININEEIYKSTENLANVLAAFEEDITISFIHRVKQGKSRNDLVVSSSGR